MCGIAGIISFNKPLDSKDCLSFIHSLRHRGPDGCGTYFDKKKQIFLGHQRLKILDVTEAGKQPMFSQDGRYVIVYNGEIYNFLEIKEELACKGYSFVSQSDTEVLLAAYVEWGEACQLKLNGMWAFAIFDTVGETLFLSRDRFGVKPLYFCLRDQKLSFASEIKAFDDLDFDLQKVADVIEHPLCLEPTSETIFKGIKKILPGTQATFSREAHFIVKKWWHTLDHVPDVSYSDTEWVERFRSLFLDSCRIRMRSDVPIGTALSGGLDSSSVLCSLAHLGVEAQKRWPFSWRKSFTAVFPHSTYDELEFAKISAQSAQAEAAFLHVQSSDLIRHLDDCIYSMEDIFDPPIGPWLLYRMYREHGIAISMDGHGADELFCGYHHQVEKACLSLFATPLRWHSLPSFWKQLKEMGSVEEDGLFLQLGKRLLKQAIQSTVGDQSRLIYRIMKRIYRSQYINQGGYGRYGWLRIPPQFHNSMMQELHSLAQFQKLSFLNRELYQDFHCRMLPVILRNFDRCSMAHGVEIRAPFMDWRVVTHAFAMPAHLKMGSLGSKSILRAAMKGILPEPVRLRKSKIGFASPLSTWMEGDLKEYIMDVVSSRSFGESVIWNGSKIAGFAERSIQEKRYQSLKQVWEFVVADRLMHVFKNLKKHRETLIR